MSDRRRPVVPGSDAAAPRHGLARVLSKQGVCSRSEAARWILAGRVRVDGRVVRDPEFPIVQGRQRIGVDDDAVVAAERIWLMLNKPRGLLTTASDERGRDTVYRCLDDAGLPWLAPVGRLDKASEGLLLFSNDPVWAAGITDPATGPDKTYHVQIDRLADAALLARLVAGVVSGGTTLSAKSVKVLRQGEKNAWLEIVLDEGRNRQIRRLLAAFDIQVLRLVRVAIGDLELGGLAKGQWRRLTAAEAASLAPLPS
ncbi:pseudouridine synthase [Pseudoxanthomonas wuyuanensis]|uniref:pseudouridine synthase n=1 Tax=Pseudoxanthomonas wuyuanensis TaxID=1073196 RepID=UPI000BE3CD17|nr:pseudouridine synthase [Pseudoxanthomonas wuyuanensis]KAF1721137.1 pseudouridine synthase [Pseudoxanthomonas wuyuanensis]